MHYEPGARRRSAGLGRRVALAGVRGLAARLRGAHCPAIAQEDPYDCASFGSQESAQARAREGETTTAEEANRAQREPAGAGFARCELFLRVVRDEQGT